MNNSEKVLKLLSNFVETGILTSQDAKKELINNLKFRRDNLIDKLQMGVATNIQQIKFGQDQTKVPYGTHNVALTG